MRHIQHGALALAAIASLVAAVDCSNASSGGNGSAGAGGATNVDGGDAVVAPDVGAGGDGASPGDLDPLCGVPGDRDCNPDRADACDDLEPPDAGTGGTGGTGATGGTGGTAAGAAGEGGKGGQAGEGGEGGADGADIVDAGADVSIPTDGGGFTPSGFACRVRIGDDGPERGCALAGQGVADAPCISSRDCRAGLACVGLEGAGRCRPYCCAGAEAACAAGEYCAKRPMVEGTDESPGPVPVCTHADHCNLSEPYPCPKDTECQCPEGTACLVVRGDGTTTCLEPAEGEAGDPCPCGWGHVCSSATDTCLELCPIVPPPSERDPCVCQAASNLPTGWGVCVAGE